MTNVFKTLFLALMVVSLAACSTPEAEVMTVLEFPDRPDANSPANPTFQWPGSWEYRLDGDHANAVVTGDTLTADPDVYFTNMTPGWHVTMKSAAGIFWHPASTAEGDFTVSSNIFLFDPGTLNEGYGIIIGGSNLDMDDQKYLYFLARRSGEFLIKTRNGADTQVVVDWTANEAVAAWTEESSDPIANEFSVQTEGNTISFSINGAVVHSQDKGDLSTDGIVGFRLNHATNVHISSLNVSMAGGDTAAVSE